ncbi:MAG: PAS domain S-box protein [Rhodospirillales bacterium]|nr:PAS domain S-box protein [Rhodospirillales bacterium]
MLELLDSSPIGLAIVSEETKERVFVNQRLVEMFGAVDAKDLLARKIEDSWVDPLLHRELDSILSRGENLVNFQAQRYRLDGSKWWVLMNTQFTTFEGKPARAGWHADITEIVETRAAIETMNDKLEARVQSRTRKLQETEKRFRDYAEVASDWFWEMDSDLKYTFVSSTYSKISGRPAKNILGRSRREMYKGQFPDEKDAWLTFLDTLDAHQNFENFVYSYRRDDGSVILMSNSGRAVFAEDGSFQGYRGIGVDITEHRALQAQLNENQARLFAFTENSPSPVTITDAQGRYLLVNDIVCKNFNLERQEILGKTADQLLPADLAATLKDQLETVLRLGKARQFQFHATFPDGVTHQFLSERFPIYAPDGALLGVGGVNTDITERKKIEDALNESESRYQIIVDMQSELITRFTPDWKLTFVNRAYCEFVDATEKKLIGSSMFEDVPTDVRERLIAYFEAFTPETAVQKNENQLMRHDGQLRDLEWSNFAQFDDNGKILGFQSVARDVTEQRKTQKEIISANEKAQEANRAKSNFLSTMSHEIRTPLNGVLGIAQLLMDSDLDPEQRRNVGTILSSGQTLLAILNDVLDMSKIEAGGLELEETAFSLRDLISAIATPFQSLVAEKGLQLSVTDSVSSSLVLKGDPVRLRQILWNLLSNAIKFTDQGEVRLSITDQAESREPQLDTRDCVIVFTIQDTGVGIARDRLDAIFDAFTQEDNSISRKFGGTGLGLSIVKQLTEKMGGMINAESELKNGARFIVTLPFYKASPAETSSVSQSNRSDSGTPSVPLNILVAEDNPVNAMIAKSFLEKMGHRVRHAENGKIAVTIASDGWAELILMDIHMPEMDGIEATKRIRQSATGQTIPIIGLTAEAFTERHRHFREAGMNDVLTKPYTVQQLTGKLNLHRPGPAPAAAPPSDVCEAGQADTASQADDHLEPVGDDQMLDGLRQQMSPEIMANLLDQAKESLLVRIQELRDGVELSDSKMIAEAAHSIKGASGSMFATRVSALAALANDQAADIEAIRALIPALEDACDATLQWWASKQQ